MPRTVGVLLSRTASELDLRVKKVNEAESQKETFESLSEAAEVNVGSLEAAREQKRTRNISTVEDALSHKLKLDIFNRCKIQIEDSVASSGVLIRKMEELGLLMDDPRLKQLMDTLGSFQEDCSGNIDNIGNIQLNYAQFSRVMEKSFPLVSRLFQGKIIIPDFQDFCKDIKDIYNRCKDNGSGKPANYIPQLARADPDKWGVSLCTVDGQRFSVGDVKDRFTIQSCSKPFTYGLCVDQLGEDVVHEYIGREPSGRCFNEIALDYNGQPFNPMVNSGAIMSAALLIYLVRPELCVSQKFEFVENFFTRLAGGLQVGFMNSVFLSERETADRNQALAYFMREQSCFPSGPRNEGGGIDITKILEFYFQTCSLEINCEVMSVMAGTLANGGICPITGEQVLNTESVKNVLSLMYSCGMYNYSGQFAFQVGLPAKSGVSGLVIVVVPNVVGFAVWSPNLDSIGNSSRGVMFCKELVKIYNFHTFNSIGHHSNDSDSLKKNPTGQKYEEKSIKLFQLLFAASLGDQVTLERAYLTGQDMNIGDYDNRTALHLACAEDKPACVKFLIEICNVDIEVKDRWGITPIMEAERLNRNQIVDMLKSCLEKRKEKTEIEVVGEDEEDTTDQEEKSSQLGSILGSLAWNREENEKIC